MRVVIYVHFLSALVTVSSKQFASCFRHMCLFIGLRVCSSMRISVLIFVQIYIRRLAKFC